MGKFNAPYRSMTPVYDDAYQAALADQSAVTIVNYSGMGKLFQISWYHEDNFYESEIGITVDGGSEDKADLDATNANSVLALGFDNAVLTSGRMSSGLEFDTSLLLKIYNDDGAAAKNTGGAAFYGHASEEVHREIIPANDPIPNPRSGYRNETYPVDILLIHYSHTGQLPATSNRVVFLPSEPKAHLKKERLLDPIFCEDLNGPRFNWVQSSFTGSKQVVIDGIYYDLTISNGVIELSSIPCLITRESFLDRFTADEQAEIIFQSHEHPTPAVRKGLQDFIFQIQFRDKINLRWATLITKVNQLETFGLIAIGRADEILSI